MDIRQAFPSKYLNAADVMALPNGRVRLVIASIQMEDMKDNEGADQKKPVIYFQGAQKGLVCNKTNSEHIMEHYGYLTEHWIGKPIELYTARILAFGKMTDSIQVQIPVETSALPQQPPPGTALPAPTQVAPDLDQSGAGTMPPADDDIPF